MTIIDLKESPYKDSKAQNGFDSVSAGKVVLQGTPHCVKHGAMNKMDPSGLWRCIMCNVGCFQVETVGTKFQKKMLEKKENQNK